MEKTSGSLVAGRKTIRVAQFSTFFATPIRQLVTERKLRSSHSIHTRVFENSRSNFAKQRLYILSLEKYLPLYARSKKIIMDAADGNQLIPVN